MRVVALLSGGKDSVMNVCHCVVNGHQLVAIAHLCAPDSCELDSYMYQTVGSEGIDLLAQSMNLPLYKKELHGASLYTQLVYRPTENDEVEDLYQLLSHIQSQVAIDAVASGAIASNYQRLRIEHVCRRMGLKSLSYLWQKEPKALLKQCSDIGLKAIIIKTASMGLMPSRHLGKTLDEIEGDLVRLESECGLHVCGEGGEYETLTLDCPLFQKQIYIESTEKIILNSEDTLAPVAYLRLKRLHLKDKNVMSQQEEALQHMYHCLGKDQHAIMLQIDNEARKIKIQSHTYQLISMTEDPPPMSDYYRWLLNSGAYKQIYRSTRLEGRSMAETTTDLLNQLRCQYHEGNATDKSVPRNVVFVHVFVRDLHNIAEMNRAYATFFAEDHHPPPARATVVGLSSLEHVDLLIRFLVYHGTSPDLQYLHVESISYWAPASIGPYSQAVKVKDGHLFIAGQIGMMPQTLSLPENNSILQEAILSLRHVLSIAKAMAYGKESIRAMLVYVTLVDYIDTALSCFKHIVGHHVPVSVMLVSGGLPKNARIEWEAIGLL
jgi:diphthine-ammonia ligase